MKKTALISFFLFLGIIVANAQQSATDTLLNYAQQPSDEKVLVREEPGDSLATPDEKLVRRLNQPFKNLDPFLSIFPNPVQRSLFINYPDASLEKVEIYDQQGEKVLALEENSINYPINVSHLPAGFYMLKVFTGTGQTIKNLIVKE